MSPVVAEADAVNPRLTREWLEYAQARGFVTDPARVRHPRDKPRVEARADEHLVKVYLRDQLIKTHPRRQPGGRTADVADMPPGVEGYATRTVDRLVAQAASYGPATGIYARRLLDGDAPWMMMRSVYRLIGLAKRYGPPAAEAACARALDVDVINVSKIESMLKNATENTPAAGLAAAAGAGPGRFARDAAEYATATGIPLQVLDGGSDTAGAGS